MEPKKNYLNQVLFSASSGTSGTMLVTFAPFTFTLQIES